MLGQCSSHAASDLNTHRDVDTRPRQLTGVVTVFEGTNPHSYIEITSCGAGEALDESARQHQHPAARRVKFTTIRRATNHRGRGR